MSFPDFEVNNNNYGEDEIQIENMGQGNKQGQNDMDFFNNQPQNENFYEMPSTNAQNNFNWGQNVPATESFNFAVDDEEEQRMQARKQEEDERRSKIISLMNEEIRVKQEYRDKAREHLDNHYEVRAKTLGKRKEFNKMNEAEFLQNRQAIKEGKKNPWERVVENIEIRESDYKGTKDVSRMRNVILVRKGDMMKMK